MPVPDEPETTPADERDPIARAAQPEPSPATQAAALAYFMGEQPAPGSQTRWALDVDFGELGSPNFQPCMFRHLANEELVKCAELAEIKKDGQVDRIDPFIRWSYIFAYACVEPDLGAAVSARRGNGQGDADAASVVRDVFRFQPGVLNAVAAKIEERSRLGTDPEQAVREVEAGKTSS